MGKRLEITIFGTLYVVGALHLSRDCVRAGITTYGQAKWNQLVNDIALGPETKKLAGEVSHTIGQPIDVIYQAQGMAMHERGFGMEVFHGGHFMPIEMVEAKNRTLEPSALMKGYQRHDMLGLFWAKREDAMFFRWDDVDIVHPDDVVLIYDTLTPLLAGNRSFDLALDITWCGRKGRRARQDKAGTLRAYEHLFHRAK